MIWLIGVRGMLGSAVARILEGRHTWIGSDREVDITNLHALRAFSASRNLRWIVNCAAYTAVDKAEDEPDVCASINHRGPANIGTLATEMGASVIHISTDYVFDGSGTRPYREGDPVSPLGVYGETKAKGEEALRAACARSYIVRTAWLYGERGNNFVSTMLRLMREKSEIGVVADQRGTPTNAADLADAIVRIIEFHKPGYGTYHFTDSGETTWYEFAAAIYSFARRAGLLDHDCTIHPLTTSQYPTKAKRPAFSVLSREKIERVFGIAAPFWRDSLEEFLAPRQSQIT
jgi:dTDP-4-dehydrorhamnose reductase